MLVSPSVLIDLVKFLVLPPLLPVPLREQLNTLDLNPTRDKIPVFLAGCFCFGSIVSKNVVSNGKSG